MRQGTSGQSGPASTKLDVFTICTALGAVLIATGLLRALDDLDEGGDYAFWIALVDFAQVAAVGVLVLLCARRLGDAGWGAALLRAAPAIGVVLVVAALALAFKDARDGVSTFWEPVNDLFYYIPLTLAALVYLSGQARVDRVLGSPSQWGRGLAVVALLVGLAIAINDVSNADSNQFWIFLSSIATTVGFALLLFGAALEPKGSMAAPSGSKTPLDMLNDPRLPNWIASGAVAIIVAGVLIGFKTMSEASSDGIFYFVQAVGFHIGLGCAVLIASRGQVGLYIRGDHIYVRYALIASMVAMFIAGLKFALDADSNQAWIFLNEAIALPSFAALGFAMFEAAQQPLRVVRN
jgi:hypothetical protein